MGHHKKKHKKHKKKKSHRKSSSDSSDSHSSSPPVVAKKSKLIGPVLPSSGPAPSSDSYGPQLPPTLASVQPQLPPQPDEDSDEDVIGPLPEGVQPSSASQLALEERAYLIKCGFLTQGSGGETSAPKREEWLTELPPEKANQFGLGPRKFKTGKASAAAEKGDRSVWTETPNSKPKQESKEEPVDTYESQAVSERNQIMDEIVKKTKDKKDSKSLLELHKEKLKKEKEKNKDEKAERRPFDRDVDLQVNRFDEAQKRAILKKAQLLDSRFSQGKSKYL